jgi:hypothetical protein
MIDQQQVMPLLLAASPSFEAAWDEHRRDYGDDMLYVALGAFAHHLLQLQQSGQTDDFSSVAQVIERLHVEGTPGVREAATIGMLEGIQNVWSNNNVDPGQFVVYLLPESAKWWGSLNDFWSGKSRYVGEGL